MKKALIVKLKKLRGEMQEMITLLEPEIEAGDAKIERSSEKWQEGEVGELFIANIEDMRALIQELESAENTISDLLPEE